MRGSTLGVERRRWRRMIRMTEARRRSTTRYAPLPTLHRRRPRRNIRSAEPAVAFESPRRPEFGDFCNESRVFARQERAPLAARRSPTISLPNSLRTRPDLERFFSRIDAVAGFINVRLAPSVWHDVDRARFCAKAIASAKRRATVYASRSSSAARIRPGRSSSSRDARCRSAPRSQTRCAFAATTSSWNGSSTMRAGSSMRSGVRSTRAIASSSTPGYPFPEDGYPGEYLRPIARRIADRDGDRWIAAPEAEWLPYFSNARSRRAGRGAAADRAALRRRVRSMAERTRAPRERQGTRRRRAPARARAHVRT